MHLAYTEPANELLARDPLALLIGMLLDQQIPMEKAFTSPYELRARLGHDLDAHEIATYDAAAFEQLFRTPPALHRFPAAMAKRVHELAKLIVDRYDGDAAQVWTGATDGAELIGRVQTLPGFGAQKARIFAALLAKQLGVRPAGWQDASAPYGGDGTFLSVADAVDDASIARVRAYKQEQKAATKRA